MADCVRELAEAGQPVPRECADCGTGICKRDAEAASFSIAELQAALSDLVGSYEDARARMRAGTADKPSVSGQTFIDRAKALLGQ